MRNAIFSSKVFLVLFFATVCVAAMLMPQPESSLTFASMASPPRAVFAQATTVHMNLRHARAH